MSDDNLAVIRRLYDALTARDGVFTFLLTLAEQLESAVTHEGMFAAGDHVVQHGRTKGKVRESQVPFEVDEVHGFELRDGRIVRFTAYIDTPAMLDALRT